MKILYLSFNQEGKGSYLRAFALAKALVSLGHQVSLCCASRSSRYEEKERDGVKLFCFPWGKRFLFGYNPDEIGARKRWLARQTFDIVHAFDMRPSCAYPALQAQNNGATFISDWADWFGKGGSVEERRNPIARGVLRPIETYFERNKRLKSRATTTICSKLFDIGLEIGIKKEKLYLLPNGFDQKIHPKTSKDDARKRLGLNPTSLIVGSLGAFFQKDFDLLQQTISLVKAQKEVDFIHMGQQPRDADYRDLRFTGHLSEEKLSLYLQACDLLHLPMADLPANHGRLPLKFSDYISAGRPVLSSRIGDVPQYIETFHAGFVAEANPADYARTLLEALNHPDLLVEAGENALGLSTKPGYRWQDRALALEAIYLDTPGLSKTNRNGNNHGLFRQT